MFLHNFSVTKRNFLGELLRNPRPMAMLVAEHSRTSAGALGNLVRAWLRQRHGAAAARPMGEWYKVEYARSDRSNRRNIQFSCVTGLQTGPSSRTILFSIILLATKLYNLTSMKVVYNKKEEI